MTFDAWYECKYTSVMFYLFREVGLGFTLSKRCFYIISILSRELFYRRFLKIRRIGQCQLTKTVGYPDYAYTFTGFTISAGDTVVMTAAASSVKAGTVTLENTTTGKTVTHSFTAETDELCEYNAEWIVEDFSSGGALVEFVDFDSVTFTDCSPSVSGSTIIDIRQSGSVLTSCSTSGTTEVVCEYTG